MAELINVPVWAFAVFFLCATMQSTWLFIDARKRDSIPWFWGIWGLIQIPMPLILYLLFVRSGWFKKRNRQNAMKMNKGADEDEY